MNEIEKRLSQHEKIEFKPHLYYSKHGDFINYFIKDDRCLAEQMGDVVIYRSIETKEIVGFRVSGIKNLVEKSLVE